MTLATAAWGHDGVAFNGKDMRHLVEGLRGVDGITTTPGVTLGFKATAQSSPNNTVSVALGWAMVTASGAGLGGMYHVWNDAALTSPTFSSTSGNGRKDRLILRVTSGVPALEVVAGTASATPAEPTITGDNYLELALVTLPASTSNITNAMITDRRVMTGKWAQPWGFIAHNIATTNGTPGGGSTTWFGVTATLVAHRRYKIAAQAFQIAAAGTGNFAYIIADGTTQLTGMLCGTGSSSSYPGASFDYIYDATANGNKTFNLRTFTDTGTAASGVATGTVPAYIRVEDVGPATNPD